MAVHLAPAGLRIDCELLVLVRIPDFIDVDAVVVLEPGRVQKLCGVGTQDPKRLTILSRDDQGAPSPAVNFRLRAEVFRNGFEAVRTKTGDALGVAVGVAEGERDG